MRFGGLNGLAIFGAAVAIYIVGFVIYGLLIDPAAWMAWEGVTAEEMEAVGASRMMFSPLMPIATAIGMGIAFKWAGVNNVANGVKWGVLIACLSAVPALFYGWVYGVGPIAGTLVDSAHLLTGHAIAGAIIARWK